MQRFRNILLVLNNGARDTMARRQAVKLAREHNASLKLMKVVEDLPWYAPTVWPIPEDLFRLEVEEVREDLSAVADTLRADGLDVSEHVVAGKKHLEVVREVLRAGHDLVIKEAESQPHFLFGSTDLHLLRKCPCPVWVISPRQVANRYARILVAVEPASPLEDFHNRLNVHMLELASALAHIDGSSVHVIHSWKPPAHPAKHNRLVSGTGMERSRLSWDLPHQRKQAIEELLNWVAPPPGGWQIHVSRGEPHDVIAEFARTEKIELLVMGTLQRPGVHGFLIGDTAEKVIHQVNCSLLTLNPNGFVPAIRQDRLAATS